jgi:hypothetical protein
MIDLKWLPREHPLRNRRLAEIGAEARLPYVGAIWRRLPPSIARLTFNEVGASWANYAEWRCLSPTVPTCAWPFPEGES